MTLAAPISGAHAAPAVAGHPAARTRRRDPALTEIARKVETGERLTAAERRPAPTARLREANSTEHERTLSQLRESREAESRARERIIELEGRLALAEHAAEKPAPVAPDVLDAVLPFVSGPGSKSGRK